MSVTNLDRNNSLEPNENSLNDNNVLGQNEIIPPRVKRKRESKPKDWVWLSIILSAPLEEEKFLGQIADQYSAPLVVSFLHSRIEKSMETIAAIKTSLPDLDRSKLNIFDLAEKTLTILDEELTVLEKAGYFEIDGIVKVKYFINQFIAQNKMYPIEFGSYGMVNFNTTPDALLDQLNTLATDKLITLTKNLIGDFLADIEEKQFNFNSNRLQKTSASLAKRELEELLKFSYSATGTYSPYGSSTSTAPKTEVEQVLKRLKTAVDLFYAQFHRLADVQINSDILDVDNPMGRTLSNGSENSGQDSSVFQRVMNMIDEASK